MNLVLGFWLLHEKERGESSLLTLFGLSCGELINSLISQPHRHR